MSHYQQTQQSEQEDEEEEGERWKRRRKQEKKTRAGAGGVVRVKNFGMSRMRRRRSGGDEDSVWICNIRLNNGQDLGPS